MFLEQKTKEELRELAEAYNKFDLNQIASLDKQIRDVTNERVNLGTVLLGLIDQSNKLEAYDISATFKKIKGVFDLFIETLILKQRKQ